MNIATSTQLSIIINAAKATGVSLPKPVRDHLDRRQRIEAKLNNIYPAGNARAAAFIAAVDAGRDPATDPEMQRVLTAEQLAGEGHRSVVSAQLDADLIETLIEHADKIITSWAKPFDTAATTLTEAHAILGQLDLADTAAVVRLGGAAAEAWASAQAAVGMLATIDQGWCALAGITHTADTGRAHAPLRMLDVTLQQWNDHRLSDTKPAPWQYVRAGLPMTLPTAAEYRARGQRLTDAAIDAQARAERVARDALKNPAVMRLATSRA